MNNIRVRFAPSPTGEVHIGSIWLAQFDWLFAHQNKGAFILRIEDTDRQRLVPGAVEKIYEALEWYGLTPDEGPNHGGQLGPYIQSQRLDIYQPYARQLVEQGSAYYCFCSPARLEELRSAQQAAKLPPRYDKRCFAIPRDQAAARVAQGESAVIRLNVPASGSVTLDDIVRGRVTFRYDQIDDSVLLKSDGWPTYHLAVVIDDHLMQISHVIRGEEWLPSTPKHLLLYQALGWTPPQFAHLPQILGANKKKLSKREGSASALRFRDQGYLPEAMQNFLVLMGWHPKGDQEVLSRQQVLTEFRLDQMNPSGAIFDQQKLDWLNGAYIRTLPVDELVRRLEPYWQIPKGESVTAAWRGQAVTIVSDRLKKLSDINDAINFTFPSAWDQEVAQFDRAGLIPKRGSAEDVVTALAWFGTWFGRQPNPSSAGELKAACLKAIAAAGHSNAGILWPVRVALSLRAASPDVFDLLALLGKSESLRRIQGLAG